MAHAFRRGSRTSYWMVTVAAAAAGMLMASGLVFASSTSEVINACRHKATGAIRYVEKYGACNGAEVAMSWNVQGNDGREGAVGPQGVPGPQGPAGPDGKDGVATLEALAGTPCENGAGVLEITSTRDRSNTAAQSWNDPVSLTCRVVNPNPSYSLRIKISTYPRERVLRVVVAGDHALCENKDFRNERQATWECTVQVPVGVQTVLTASVTDEGYTDEGGFYSVPWGGRLAWAGCDEGTHFDNPCNVTMTGPRVVEVAVE
jgi:hypothetical protein